jgi:hypothetical protein
VIFTSHFLLEQQLRTSGCAPVLHLRVLHGLGRDNYLCVCVCVCVYIYICIIYIYIYVYERKIEEREVANNGVVK